MTSAYSPTTALIVVDVQNDFADPSGSLYVAGGERVIADINAELAAARAAGAQVVYTQDWHPAVSPHFATSGGIWPEHCVAGTWGAALHPALEQLSGDDVTYVHKGLGPEDGYSAFTGRDLESGAATATDLATTLQRRGITSAVVVGLAGDYCVKATALDAAATGLVVRVPLRTTAFVELAAGDSAAAIAALRAAGVAVDES